MAAHARLTVVEWVALVTVSCIAAGDLITYSTPGAFLGQALAAQGATPSQVMLAYGLSGAMTPVACVLVLLCQSHPAVAGLTRASKWGVVVVAQFLGLASSIIVLLWPEISAVIAARALHGVAAAGYLVYCLSLLVELSPKQHLATGIAAMAAGVTAGDSIAPVVGAIIYDRAGFRAAFLLPAAFGSLVLLAALLMYPIWRWSPRGTTSPQMQISLNSSRLPGLPQSLGDAKHNTKPEVASADAANWARLPSMTKGTGHDTHPERQQDSTASEESQSVTDSFNKDSSSTVTVVHTPAASIKLDNTACKDLPHCGNLQSFTVIKPSGGSFNRPLPCQKLQPAAYQSLDFKSVASTIRDPVIFCQCVVLFLEQMVRAIITPVLPATMSTPMWLVGVIYIANVAGAVMSPFAVDYIINRFPKIHTQLLAASLSLIMGISSILSITFSTRIAVLCVVLFVYGASQAAVGTLVYVHVAQRLDVIGHQAGLQVSMCMYVFADTAAGGVGNLTGGALQHQAWATQLAVVALGAALATCLGVAVGCTSYVREKQPKAVHASNNAWNISEGQVDSLSQVIIAKSSAQS